ncbi:MAG: ATP-dependent DNA helicase RecG [Caulobacterales bacterium 32-69-10]|nr:MAG: ATP-dependent DNA helicase RecG [Caulobacterales bacterium 32-69-10]
MRPEILFPLFAASDTLKGVGPKLAPLVDRAAGPLVRDLAFLQPASLIVRRATSVADAREGEPQVFGLIIDHHSAGQAGRPWRIRCRDETGFIFLNWFKGQGPHLERYHPVGAHRAVAGKPERFGAELSIAHPDYILPIERAGEIPLVEPVYPATAGLPSRTLRKLALEALAKAPDLPEWQDPAWRARQGWPSWLEALQRLHAPQSEADLAPAAPHRQRLAYDELLAHQLAMKSRKAARRAEPAPVIADSALAAQVEAALPFALTGAQARTLGETRTDLASGERMSRLVQGDVGSGKTVVAMLAMADVAAAGKQSALMAPTEILARQHFETIRQPLEAQGVHVVLLTGRDKGAGRAAKLAELASGEAAVAVGTHALFQDEVRFKGLALAVVDEQHRFGVSERRRLQEKGASVHLLALSATPIPRTLELTLFGDLDVSRIDEKPPGRKPVLTTAAPTSRLEEVVARLRKATAAGAQAFWICPLVSESELLDVTAAEDRAADLREALGPRVGLIHGQMPAPEKDAVMAAFADGTIQVLVATTVVEVGVNVPNATIMVVEHAERFGLAQLHQLRGRVGRGAAQSFCLLLHDKLSDAGAARLDVLRQTEDGFVIAEKDLALRGGGDLMGLKQSGFPDYRFAEPAAHAELIAAAADDAKLILARGPGDRTAALEMLEELFDWRSEKQWAAAG